MTSSDEIHPGSGEAGAEAGRGPVGWRSLQGWPALLGAAFAAFVAFDMFRGEERGQDLASIVAASALVYLCAAAVGKPGFAWAALLGSVIVITVSKMGLVGIEATWLLLGLALLFGGYGLLRGATRPFGGLPLQSIAMIAFGAVAGVALFIDQTAGAYLVAAGLVAHAGWDVYHHRANRVVVRSLAEFCLVLDLALAAAIVVATMQA